MHFCRENREDLTHTMCFVSQARRAGAVQPGELGLFSQEKRNLQGDPTATFNYLKRTCKKVGDGLLTRAHSGMAKGIGFKLEEEAPVISIEMNTSAMWFMVFGIMPLAKFVDDGPRGSQCPEEEDHGCENNKLSADPEIEWDLLFQLEPLKSKS
ncbi:hypothetical protein TURU_066447 [Turdus rufiventris]|nr:hypothetical protein TURU_066447 [Turdus rufiventris]